jgi:hypothetical protein
MGAAWPTMKEALARRDGGMAAADRGVDPTWSQGAEESIVAMAVGHRFLAEDVTAQHVVEGLPTPSARAMGPLVRRLALRGVIRRTSEFRPARSSNGALKIVWERTDKQ